MSRKGNILVSPFVKEEITTENNTNDLMFASNEYRYHKMVDEVQDYAILLLNKDVFIAQTGKLSYSQQALTAIAEEGIFAN